MHLRAVLRGMLKRTNSSNSTTTRAFSATAETRPTSSDGATAKIGDKINITDSIVEGSVSGASEADSDRERNDTAKDADDKPRFVEKSHGDADEDDEEDDDDEDYYSLHSRQRGRDHSDVSTEVEGQSSTSVKPGPKTDRRLVEGIKLQQAPAVAPQAATDTYIATNTTSSTHGLIEDTNKGNPTLLVQLPTPDRLDSHVDAAQEPTRGLSHPPASLPTEAASTTSPQEPVYTTIDDRDDKSVQVHNHKSTRSTVTPGTELPPQSSKSKSPAQKPVRRQSLINGANSALLRTLLDPAAAKATSSPVSPVTPSAPDHFSSAVVVPTNLASMLTRKIWVRRPGASPTMVSIKEDDLVDDVRDMILRKYANSLGRSFDSPDVTLRIVSRAEGQRAPVERLLGPDEDMCRTLDSYFPGGQTVEDALVIDVPQRRTPRLSPRVYNHGHGHVPYDALDEFRPQESGNDYFPPMPAVIPPSAPHSSTSASAETRSHQSAVHADPTRSISVLSTGQLPPLPSPGAVRRHREHRPKYQRQHTSSPTILSQNTSVGQGPAPSNLLPNLTVSQHLPFRKAARPRLGSNASEQHPSAIPSAPPLPTPPAPEAPPTANTGSTPPTPAIRDQSTLRPTRPRRNKKQNPTASSTSVAKSPAATSKSALTSSLLDNSVPPINVLIVEDNIINLKLLEAFMKRLKVRWSTAMNGQIAVDKWRAGGFHLVLMDIQLPIMSGLEATKEIRRLERVNGIGVFSNSAPGTPAGIKQRAESANGGSSPSENGHALQVKDAVTDKLDVENGLFKSPVIIVALTASSLQSDRHEALAAGCNDFLTKPVNFVWLERKVKEWGCMQALIDFDGWRKWKDFAGSNKEAVKTLPASTDSAAKPKEKKVKRTSRASLDGGPTVSRPANGGDQNSSAIVSDGTPDEA